MLQRLKTMSSKLCTMYVNIYIKTQLQVLNRIISEVTEYGLTKAICRPIVQYRYVLNK